MMTGLSVDTNKINEYLLSQIQGEPVKLYQSSRHLIEHGGKRLRPHLVLKSCEILGGNPNLAMPAAAAIEFIHVCTLIHDDIIDGDEFRHGVPTVHEKYGLPFGILGGDTLFAMAFKTLSSKNNLPTNVSTDLCSQLSDACIRVCEGEVLDMEMAESSKFPTEDRYIKMIEAKTSILFEAACSMGAICAQTNKQDIENLNFFGKNLGIAFQLIDDLLGIVGESKITNKPVGNDIREGKKTLPILLALDRSDDKKREKILKAFNNPKATKDEIKNAVDVITSLGIESAIQKEAMVYSSKAKKFISSYDSPVKKELELLLDFVIQRKF